MALVAPEQYNFGRSAIDQVQAGVAMAKTYKNVQLWPSIFTAMEVIVNRKTPAHRDKGGCLAHYDLLVSAGTHKQAYMALRELGGQFSYNPGTVLVFAGKVFLHEVMDWEGGKQLCIAHFMKDSVHDRLQIPRPTYPTQNTYMQLLT